MTALEKLKKAQEETNSLICAGLDSDTEKMPPHLAKKGIDGILEFNKTIIDAVSSHVCAFKLNFAFYERYGAEGFEVLKKTFDYIPEGHFKIADAKRGDIGNTSENYARACFEYFGADSATIMPYMGMDAAAPFLKYEDKLNFLVTLSSNPGSEDFQRLVSNGQPLFASVLEKAISVSKKENLGFVIGATYPEELEHIRESAPERVFLIPGIGVQGGRIPEVISANKGGPCLIAVSRAIIYASSDKNFAEAAEAAAKTMKEEAAS